MPKMNDVKCVAIELEEEVDPLLADAALDSIAHMMLAEYFARHPEHAFSRSLPFPMLAPEGDKKP